MTCVKTPKRIRRTRILIRCADSLLRRTTFRARRHAQVVSLLTPPLINVARASSWMASLDKHTHHLEQRSPRAPAPRTANVSSALQIGVASTPRAAPTITRRGWGIAVPISMKFPRLSSTHLCSPLTRAGTRVSMSTARTRSTTWRCDVARVGDSLKTHSNPTSSSLSSTTATRTTAGATASPRALAWWTLAPRARRAWRPTRMPSPEHARRRHHILQLFLF